MKTGLSYPETVARTEGEIMDMIACWLIAQGTKQKFTYNANNFIEIMRMK